MKHIITGILAVLLLCTQTTAMDLKSIKSRNHVKKVTLGENGTVIRELQLKQSEPLKGAPDNQVKSFIEMYNDNFNIDLNSLVPEIRNKSKAADVVTMKQFKNGLPVFDGTVHAVLKNNQLQLLKNGYKYHLNTENKMILDKNICVEKVKEQIKNSIQVTSEPEMGYYNGLLCFRIDITAPKAHYRVYANASDGAILFKRNMLHFAPTTGTGKVFNPNPIASSGITDLVDNNDATSATLDGERIEVPLAPLDGTGYLRNMYVDMTAPGLGSPALFGYTAVPGYDPGEGFSTTSTYDYTRDQWAFEEVNIFYWVTETNKYIQNDLGFPTIMDYVISIDAHYCIQDQSFFAEWDHGLHMGDGGVDDGEDTEIVLHELGHAITHDIIPGFGSSHEASSMDEGNSDFYAASFGPDTRYPTLIGEWDASSYDMHTPPYLRTIESTKHYPENMTNADNYADSAIWSATLWQIRGDLGKDVTNEIFIESLTYLDPGSVFEDGANAMLLADQNLNGGANYPVIHQYFVQRGILEDEDLPEETYSNHLYFPLVFDNSDYVTYLGLINPGTELTNYKITFVDPTGHVIDDPLTGTLDPMARQYNDIAGYLTNVPPNSFWVIVGYDNRLDGYVNLLSGDSKKSCFVKASKTLDDMVYVPHIAFKNNEFNYWYSYTSVINGSSSAANVQFNYLTDVADMVNPSTAYTQAYFDWYEDFFESNIPQNFPDWGILESDGQNLAGMEMFSPKPESVHQLGGLDLGSQSSDILYFGHVDTGGTFWWTGFALENVSDETITVDITPYSSDGTALTPVSYDMQPNEKIVKLVEYFWTDKGLTYPAETAWLEARGSGQMIGYELFGTYNNKLLAGINAPYAGDTSLLYPHIHSDTIYYTSLTVVNTGDQATTLTAKGYSTYGEKVIEEVINADFQPNQKIAVEVSSLFSSQMPSDVVSIVLESDQPMIGFELWINHQNAFPDWEHMSGMLAMNMTQQSGGPVYSYSFEKAEGEDFTKDGWEVYALEKNTTTYSAWMQGTVLEGSSIDFTSQTIPDKNDFAFGYWGDYDENSGTWDHVHQLLATPPIELPANASSVSFYSQNGYPTWALNSNFFMITEDLVFDDNDGITGLVELFEFTPTYIKNRPTSFEFQNTEGFVLNQWENLSFDITNYAGKTVRFVFILDSDYEESWHLDLFEVH